MPPPRSSFASSSVGGKRTFATLQHEFDRTINADIDHRFRQVALVEGSLFEEADIRRFSANQNFFQDNNPMTELKTALTSLLNIFPQECLLGGELVRAFMRSLPHNIDETNATLSEYDYVCGRDLATVIFLALTLGKPIFLEGEPGVGKTEIAKVLARALERRLIRLQCYEGLDAASAVYEWNFAAQMIAIRAAEGKSSGEVDALKAELFSEAFLIKRPLLEAMEPHPEGPPVLLIDELDRADEPFEAFLLEALSDFQVTIPEIGTISAPEPPIVVLTSNRTREVHDALKRRCFYHWVGYPDFERELDILRRRAPDCANSLSRDVVAFVQALRNEDLFKAPGVAETIDWARCLVALDVVALSPDVISDTMGALLKYQDDIAKVTGSEISRILTDARRNLAAVT